jgi:hypothetical protein
VIIRKLLYVKRYVVTSHAACSNALKPLEILIRAVVTIVVSRADRNRQNHKPAMMVCNRRGLMLGTLEGTAVAASEDFVDIVASDDARKLQESTVVSQW